MSLFVCMQHVSVHQFQPSARVATYLAPRLVGCGLVGGTGELWPNAWHIEMPLVFVVS